MAKRGKLSVKEFKELGYEKLHAELKRLLAQSQRMVVWFGAEERLNLLPALLAMKELVAQPGRREPDPAKPNWEDECRLLGITPEMVRQWRSRTASESDIRRLLGELPMEPRRRTAPTNAQVLKHLQALTDAVLSGDEAKAEQLAAAFTELYEF